MEYQKPEWLLKAEEQINEFKETPAGKRTEGQQRRTDTSINNGTTTGNKLKAVKKGLFIENENKRAEWRKKGGSIQGRKMADENIGMFVKDKEKKSEWGRMGGNVGGPKTAITNLKRYGKEIQAFDYETGELIGTWPSKGKMVKELELNKGGVNNVMAGKANKYKGMTFRYTK